MVQRRNLYLIFKEALNNALKYAECTLIEVELHCGHELRLIVRDNGSGFLPEEVGGTVSSGHNGLYNMQKRAREIGGHVKIQSAPRQGTNITFHFSP
jgi:signal transduction histidine kinase